MACMFVVTDEKQDGEVVVVVEKNKMAAKVVVEDVNKMVNLSKQISRQFPAFF
jgi:hypothetical protein